MNTSSVPAMEIYYGFILVKKLNGKIGSVYSMTKKECTIGRDLGCDIRLYLENVSAQHCTILYIDDKAYIRDKSSANTTKVNGKSVGRNNFLLRHSDEIEICGRKFVWEYAKSYAESDDISSTKSGKRSDCITPRVSKYFSNKVNTPSIIHQGHNKTLTPAKVTPKTSSKTLISINKLPIVVAESSISKEFFDDLKNSLIEQNAKANSQSEPQVMKSDSVVLGRNIPLICDYNLTPRKSWLDTNTSENSLSKGTNILNRLSSERLAKESTPELNSSYHYENENVEFDSSIPKCIASNYEHSIDTSFNSLNANNLSNLSESIIDQNDAMQPNNITINLPDSEAEPSTSRRDTYSVNNGPIIIEQNTTPAPRRSILKCSKTSKPNRSKSTCRMVQFARLPKTDSKIYVTKKCNSAFNFTVTNDETNESGFHQDSKKVIHSDVEEYDDDLDGVQPLDISVSSLFNSPILDNSCTNKSSKRGSRGNKVMNLINSFEKRTNESPKHSIRASDLLSMSGSLHGSSFCHDPQNGSDTLQSSVSSTRRINLEHIFETEDSLKSASNIENETRVQDKSRVQNVERSSNCELNLLNKLESEKLTDDVPSNKVEPKNALECENIITLSSNEDSNINFSSIVVSDDSSFFGSQKYNDISEVITNQCETNSSNIGLSHSEADSKTSPEKYLTMPDNEKENTKFVHESSIISEHENISDIQLSCSKQFELTKNKNMSIGEIEVPNNLTENTKKSIDAEIYCVDVRKNITELNENSLYEENDNLDLQNDVSGFAEKSSGIEKDHLDLQNDVCEVVVESISIENDQLNLQNDVVEHITQSNDNETPSMVVQCMSEMLSNSVDELETAISQHTENIETFVVVEKVDVLIKVNPNNKINQCDEINDTSNVKDINKSILDAIEVQLDKIHSDDDKTITKGESPVKEIETIFNSKLSTLTSNDESIKKVPCPASKITLSVVHENSLSNFDNSNVSKLTTITTTVSEVNDVSNIIKNNLNSTSIINDKIGYGNESINDVSEIVLPLNDILNGDNERMISRDSVDKNLSNVDNSIHTPHTKNTKQLNTFVQSVKTATSECQNKKTRSSKKLISMDSVSDKSVRTPIDEPQILKTRSSRKLISMDSDADKSLKTTIDECQNKKTRLSKKLISMDSVNDKSVKTPIDKPQNIKTRSSRKLISVDSDADKSLKTTIDEHQNRKTRSSRKLISVDSDSDKVEFNENLDKTHKNLEHSLDTSMKNFYTIGKPQFESTPWNRSKGSKSPAKSPENVIPNDVSENESSQINKNRSISPFPDLETWLFFMKNFNESVKNASTNESNIANISTSNEVEPNQKSSQISIQVETKKKITSNNSKTKKNTPKNEKLQSAVILCDELRLETSNEYDKSRKSTRNKSKRHDALNVSESQTNNERSSKVNNKQTICNDTDEVLPSKSIKKKSIDTKNNKQCRISPQALAISIFKTNTNRLTRKKKMIQDITDTEPDIKPSTSESEHGPSTESSSSKSSETKNISKKKKKSSSSLPVTRINLRARVGKSKSGKLIEKHSKSISEETSSSDTEISSLRSSSELQTSRRALRKKENNSSLKKSKQIEKNTKHDAVKTKKNKSDTKKLAIVTRLTRRNSTLTESSLKKMDKKNKTTSPIKPKSTYVTKTIHSKESSSKKSHRKTRASSSSQYESMSETDENSQNLQLTNDSSKSRKEKISKKAVQSHINLSTKSKQNEKVEDTTNSLSQLNTRSRKRAANTPISQPRAKGLKRHISSKVASMTISHISNSSQSSPDKKMTRNKSKATVTQVTNNILPVKGEMVSKKEKPISTENTKSKKHEINSEDSSNDSGPSTRKRIRTAVVKDKKTEVKKSDTSLIEIQNVDTSKPKNNTKVRFNENDVKKPVSRPKITRSTTQVIEQIKQSLVVSPRKLRVREKKK